MKRRTMVAHAALIAVSLTVGVVAATGGNTVAGALAVALAAWIAYASYLLREVHAAKADRQLVIDSWTQYANSGMNALERARKIRAHQEAKATVPAVHAPGFPCRTRAPYEPAHPTPAMVTCPLCVALTQESDIEVQS